MLYVLALVAVVVCVDVLFLRHQPWWRLITNIGIVLVFGVDRVLFSVDYPFGANASGRALLDALPISPADKAKVAGLNAERLLRLA